MLLRCGSQPHQPRGSTMEVSTQLTPTYQPLSFLLLQSLATKREGPTTPPCGRPRASSREEGKGHSGRGTHHRLCQLLQALYPLRAQQQWQAGPTLLHVAGLQAGGTEWGCTCTCSAPRGCSPYPGLALGSLKVESTTHHEK